MIEPLLDLPPHLRSRLVTALESGLLEFPATVVALGAVLGEVRGLDDVAGALRELDRMRVTGLAAAAWIRSLERIESRKTKPDLVWSGPEVPGLHARDTRRVFDELLASVERSVWLSTYAFFDGQRAFAVLARRMDERPLLRANILLNIQRKRGDTTDSGHLVRRFADQFWRRDWPGGSRPAVYFDPRALEPNGAGGVLHAKAVVADDEAVLVTSANLTQAAFDRNIEIGVLMRDSALAATVSLHFATLIERSLLHPLPGD